ncbi:unnamed protein product [Paramecium sonneborni]|uniref:Uncharacterized protein n=1 Tax=Paramecium sonneborni TaxID=65129 RepID=A0A8S1RGR6_9CILI|nr:unnamed protein product [Paramecium sonneborni]
MHHLNRIINNTCQSKISFSFACINSQCSSNSKCHKCSYQYQTANSIIALLQLNSSLKQWNIFER